jgi:hypothetical protein
MSAVYSLRPTTSRIAARLFGATDPRRLARREVVVEPSHPVPDPPPALYTPLDLELIQTFRDGQQLQMDRLRGITSVGPCLALELPPTHLLNGQLLGHRSRLVISPEKDPLLFRSSEPVERVPELALASSYAGAQYFGHPLTDDLPTALLATDFAPVAQLQLRSEGPHVTTYRSLTGVRPRFVWSLRIDKPWVFVDASLTDSKIRRIRDMQSRIASQVPTDRGDKRVYLRRRGFGTDRSPHNEPQFEEFLLHHGWTVIGPEELPLADVIATLRGASIVAGVEGSQMDHCFFALEPGSTVIQLQPPHLFNLVRKEMCDRLGISYAFHTGRTADSTGWVVEIDRFQRLVELVEKREG